MRRRLIALLITACVVMPAAARDRLTPVDAETLRAELEQRRGTIVLVNFWATWCRPCLEEIPILQRLHEAYRDAGFTLVAVSLDQPDSADALVRPFMEKWFPGFDSYLSLEREMDDIVSSVDPAWNEILPTSYLLDRNGVTVERIQGVLTEAEFAARITAQLDR